MIIFLSYLIFLDSQGFLNFFTPAIATALVGSNTKAASQSANA